MFSSLRPTPARNRPRSGCPGRGTILIDDPEIVKIARRCNGSISQAVIAGAITANFAGDEALLVVAQDIGVKEIVTVHQPRVFSLTWP